MSEHVSVLLNESIDGLNIKSDGTYVDATLGRAGHSYHILTKLSNLGKLYCFDKDIEAMEASNQLLSTISPQILSMLSSEELSASISSFVIAPSAAFFLFLLKSATV